MECARAWDLLSAYLDGDLPEREREGIAEHLRHCARCAEEEGALKETLSLLKHLPPRSFRVRRKRSSGKRDRHADGPAKGGRPRQAAPGCRRPGGRGERGAPRDIVDDAREKGTSRRFRARSRENRRTGQGETPVGPRHPREPRGGGNRTGVPSGLPGGGIRGAPRIWPPAVTAAGADAFREGGADRRFLVSADRAF